jgi:hypothetical protein
MKKTFTKEQIIFQYEKSCEIIKQATLDGDYKKNNKEGKLIIQIYKYLEENKELSNNILHELFYSGNVVTRTKAAAHCLSLGLWVQEAVEILENAATDKSTGIFGFNAKMTLKVWKEQGKLKVYSEQK